MYRTKLHAVLHDVRAGILDRAMELESFWRTLGESAVAEGSECRRMVKEYAPLRHANAGELLIGRKHRIQRDIDDLPDLSNAILLTRSWPCAATEHCCEEGHSIRSMGLHTAGALVEGIGTKEFTSV